MKHYMYIKMSRSKYWRFIEFVIAHPEFEWDGR
jgi:hypothetical protein